MELISCKDLNFTYPGCEKPALCDIDFSVDKSEFVLLCGKSGCGKSTLLRHLKKNLMPYGRLEGSIRYCGQEIEGLDNRVSTSEIGFVLQSPDNQIVTDKVWHELAFGLESLGLDNRTMKHRVAEMASFFGIQTWFRKSISELSGGQKQLLNLAAIMVMQPKLLVLDEPTSQLDPIAASDFLATLKKINAELGTTILISEHRLEELFPLADRVLVMDKGKLLIDAPPRDAAAQIFDGTCGNMFLALPAVTKIAHRVGCGHSCPLTVREGRAWLEKALGEAEPQPQRGAPVQSKSFGQDSAIVMKDVWFRYSKTEQDILRGVDLSVNRGELYAVLGGNGVGKSTMFKVLTRLVKPHQGEIKINGESLDKLSDKKLFFHGLSMLPQNPQALFTEITAWEELMEALRGERLSEPEMEARVRTMLERMELEGLETAHPYDLSVGEQQRLALGKILLRKPAILLLDEPTKGLDAFFKGILSGIFRELCDGGMTILMASHDIEFCVEYADRCSLFFDGEIVSTGAPGEFFSGNHFYTTAANRLAGQWFPTAVTWEEVSKLCAEAMTRRRQKPPTENARLYRHC
jgi:energy-coupling factor transport system ATP-binding protein